VTLTRTDVERRYLSPGSRLTEPQWRYVASFLALDDLLESAGRRFGKSYVRALLVRILADRESGAIEGPERPELLGEWLIPPEQIDGWTDPDPTPPHGIPIPDVRPEDRLRVGHDHLAGTTMSEAARRVWNEAHRLDVRAGRTTETTPERIARAVREALSPPVGETVPDPLGEG
jgi:hypothetical protein